MYDYKKIIELIQNKVSDLQAIYIFGTSGTPYERTDSDLDVAILADSSLDPLQRWDLSKTIAQHIDKDVDVVDLRAVSTVFCFEILKSGKRIYCKNKVSTDLFETTAYSMYIHFIEDRQPLVDDIKKRGGQILNG